MVTHGDGTNAALSIGSLNFGSSGGQVTLTTAGTPGILAGSISATGAAGSVLVNASNSAWITGQTYNLISYTGGLSGLNAFTSGTIAGLAARQTATITNPAGYIALTIGGDVAAWTGAANGNWTTATIASPKNWKLVGAGTGTDFLNNDQSLFNDTATGTTDVVISDANVTPASVIFNNSTKNYSVSGSFGIATGSLTKGGSGTLILNTANSYAGPTTVNGGTLNLRNASAVPATSSASVGTSAALEIEGGVTTVAFPLALNGGTLRNVSGSNTYAGLLSVSANSTIDAPTAGDTFTLSNTGNVTGTSSLTLTGSGNGVIASALGNSGGLVKSGTGTWRLNKASAATMAGGTTVNAGILELGAGGGTGSIRGALTINNGGQVNTMAGDAIGYTAGAQVNVMTLNSGGTFNIQTGGNQGYRTQFVMNGGTVSATGGGSVNFTDSAEGFSAPQIMTQAGSTSLWSAAVTIRSASLGVDTADSSTLTMSGAIGGGAKTLNKTGNGTLVLSGANTHTTTNVTAGTLRIGSQNALGSSALIVGDGASARLESGLTVPANVASLSLNGSAYLDVADEALAINYGGTSPASMVLGMLTQGYGTGFTSGSIRSSAATSTRGIGWIDTGTAVTIASTAYGDANLDLAVNFNDLLALAANYGLSGKTWSAGDFNYDGTVNFSDLLVLAANYGQTVTASFSGDWALAQSVAAPEPTALVAAGGLSALALRRRRR
ncbi:MAG: autotransporter-associated beta strand repeat-containing protein [Tepidisphaeraceae bacterium]